MSRTIISHDLNHARRAREPRPISLIQRYQYLRRGCLTITETGLPPSTSSPASTSPLGLRLSTSSESASTCPRSVAQALRQSSSLNVIRLTADQRRGYFTCLKHGPLQPPSLIVPKYRFAPPAFCSRERNTACAAGFRSGNRSPPPSSRHPRSRSVRVANRLTLWPRLS